MASLQRSPSGVFNLAFRYCGQRFLRSLETADESEAREKKCLVERTLRHLRDSVLSLAEGATADDLWQFLRSGGRQAAPPKLVKTVKLGVLSERYLDSYPVGSKERSTLDTETHHLNHFQRVLGKSKAFHTIGVPDWRGYVKARQGEPGKRGRTIQPATIGKELQTARQLWPFAKAEGYVSGENPISFIRKPRGSEKPPFKTWEEIEAEIAMGGLTDGEIALLWDSLFLREKEIGEFLTHAKKRAAGIPRCPYIYPALAFCAYTGTRRSEMFRCRVHDVNGRVVVREKKKRQDERISFREVPLHPGLEVILNDWLANHPGGQFLFCKNNGNRLDDKTSREAFWDVTKRSKWKVLSGYHVLRHSFASNLARHGVDQRKIDEFMGHQTEEMRRRYRHLFPEDKKAAISVLNF